MINYILKSLLNKNNKIREQLLLSVFLLLMQVSSAKNIEWYAKINNSIGLNIPKFGDYDKVIFKYKYVNYFWFQPVGFGVLSKRDKLNFGIEMSFLNTKYKMFLKADDHKYLGFNSIKFNYFILGGLMKIPIQNTQLIINIGCSKLRKISLHGSLTGFSPAYFKTLDSLPSFDKIMPYLSIGIERKIKFHSHYLGFNSNLGFIFTKYPSTKAFLRTNGSDYFGNINSSRTLTLSFGINFYFKERHFFNRIKKREKEHTIGT